jgi:hypothetical protein
MSSKQIYRIPPRGLDKFAASPAPGCDKAEFRAAFDAARATYPGEELGYIGTDGRHHFFQVHGVAEARLVPVSRGWKMPSLNV